jgi:catechol 2,3-dioxygenase-like lactoylglutathione lyase family enzyme
MELLGVHHVAVQVSDLERSGAFYRGVLGLRELVRHKTADGNNRSIWLELPGGGFLALETLLEREASQAPRRAGYSLLALRIRPHQRADIIRELAGKGIRPVHQTQWTVYIEDPEGNRIGLSHHPEDAPGAGGS